MRTFNQIRSDISVVGRGLNKDENLRYVWGGVPAGAHACLIFHPEGNELRLPLINQEFLTDEQIAVLICFDRHERLHSLKSCPKFMTKRYNKLNPLEQELLQRLEDSRIETGNHSMTRSEMERNRIHGVELVMQETGNDQYVKNFRMGEFERVCNDYEKISKNNRWGYLAMALQFKAANYGNFPIPEELKSLFDIAMKILSDGRFTKAKKIRQEGTWIVGDIAQDIYRAWMDQDNQEEKDSNSDQSDSSGSNGQSDSSGSNGQSESSGSNGQSESNGQQEASGSKSPGDSISTEFIYSNRGEDKLDPNTLGDKVGQISLDQENNGVFTERDLNIPYNMEDEDIVPQEFHSKFSEICSTISDKANELRGILSVILRARTKSRIHKHRRNGRVNRRSLAKVPTGKTRIMQRVKYGIDMDTDFQLIIDLSGSMKGRKSLLAACVAVTLTEALSSVHGVDTEIIGFNSLATKNQNIDSSMSRSSDRVMTYFFKTFEENYHAIKSRMGAMAVTMDNGGAVGGCNVDHEVIWSGAHRLLKRGKKKKIQLVLSDGRPNGVGGTYGGFLKSELIRVNQKIRELGVNQVAIGIQDDSVKKFYKKNLTLYDLDRLDQEALRLLAELFLHA